MRLYLDCMSCIINHIVTTTQRLVEDEEKRFDIIKRSIKELDQHIFQESSAPRLTWQYYETLKETLGVEDFYREEKKMFNSEMMAMEDEFRTIIRNSSNPVKAALILSGAANIIDLGIKHSVDHHYAKSKILEVYNNILPIDKGDKLLEELENCKSLMYIGDNCGEAVLDKFVLEAIGERYPEIDIYYAVRGTPILNDITLEEAHEIGLERYAKVISSGSKLPGTVIEECTEEFQRIYNSCDVKIFKGMGNVETSYKNERDAYYVFMIKCSFMAKLLDVRIHDVILEKGNPLYNKEH
jgi:damage-control phosphatase, subfamily I